MKKLSGEEGSQIRTALLEAFPMPEQMGIVVSDADIGKSWEDVTFGATSYDAAIRHLVDYAVGQHRLLKLLSTAAAAASDNPELARAAAIARRYATFRPDRSLGEVESILFKEAAFQNVEDWLNKLDRLRRVTCRIEPQPAREGIGNFATGFLVAQDVVITNDHVASGHGGMPGFWGDPARAAKVRCRFGCEYRQDGSMAEGKTYALSKDFALLRSPSGELDFALLRLERPAGDEVIGGRPRGFVTPVSHAFESSEPLLILQHPEAQPMKLSFGALLPSDEWPPGGIAYKVNTAAGSSGSACATQALEVAAIHHWGSAQHNRGVLMSEILALLREHPERARLEQAGLQHLLSSPE